MSIEADQERIKALCQSLPLSASTYYHQKEQLKSPELRSEHAKRDEYLSHHIKRIWIENRSV